MPRCEPRTAAYLVGVLLASSLAYDVLRMPVQVADSLGELLAAAESPSVTASFVGSAANAAYLRPLRIAQIKALFDLADGRYYWLVYRGFHAVLVVATILLFTRALRVTTWSDWAAAVFALTVLTGLHTFRGTIREAFPINHFLEIALLCLVTLNLALSRGGRWVDAAAAATFVAASLVLESGLLVWVVALAALACGFRGISRRGMLTMTALFGVYVLTRVLYIGAPGLDERSAGYMLGVLEPPEIQARFGESPLSFYAYNVGASVMSVLLSEPQSGVFVAVRGWLQNELQPRTIVAILSSVFGTALIAWVGWALLSRRGRALAPAQSWYVPIFIIVLAANAMLSYAYTKDEIVSVAGVFYALAAYAGAQYALQFVSRPVPRTVRALVCVMLLAGSSLWAFRSAGIHHMARGQAFRVRNDWGRMPEARYAGDGAEAALIRRLRRDALDARVPNPDLLPRWADRWWGE